MAQIGFPESLAGSTRSKTGKNWVSGLQKPYGKIGFRMSNCRQLRSIIKKITSSLVTLFCVTPGSEKWDMYINYITQKPGKPFDLKGNSSKNYPEICQGAA